jgi:hypothetical protein
VLRLLLALAAALALAGCRSGTDAPAEEAREGPAPAPPPAERDVVFEEVLPAEPNDDAPDTGLVLHPPTDEAPPEEPVPVRVAAGSCDVRAVEPVCFAFSGPGWTPPAAQAECANAGGVYQSAVCPTEERVGECVHRPDGDVAREVVHTFYRPMEPLIAEAVCEGTFRAF